MPNEEDALQSRKPMDAVLKLKAPSHVCSDKDGDRHYKNGIERGLDMAVQVLSRHGFKAHAMTTAGHFEGRKG